MWKESAAYMTLFKLGRTLHLIGVDKSKMPVPQIEASPLPSNIIKSPYGEESLPVIKLSQYAKIVQEEKVVGEEVAVVENEPKTANEIVNENLTARWKNSRYQEGAGVALVRDEVKSTESTIKSQAEIRLEEAKNRIQDKMGTHSDYALVKRLSQNRLQVKNS